MANNHGNVQNHRLHQNPCIEAAAPEETDQCHNKQAEDRGNAVSRITNRLPMGFCSARTNRQVQPVIRVPPMAVMSRTSGSD